MTKYREILRLASLGLSQQNIADSSGVSKKTVNRVLKRAKELNIFWPLEANETDAVLAEKLFPSAQKQVSSTKRMPDFNYIQKELLRNGVNKKLLWTEYLEECRQSGDEPLMYSQFCYYIQQDEQKRRATMHINRKPGEQIEVDWAGDPAQITDPDTGEIIPAFLFVGVMTYSQYPYVEAFINEKQRAWITAALRNEQFFSLAELNQAIRRKLKEFVNRPFQKKEGTRYEIFRDEELPLLAKLPATPYELAEWKQATVQFNYHISVDGMLYSVPYEFIKRKVDVRVTDTVIEIFYNHNRIASHRRLYGRKGQYSTVTEHMPADHQAYLEWNGDRFRKWTERIGTNTCKVVNAILASQRVEQQSYRSCTGLLKLADKYSDQRLEAACRKALSYTASPSYKSIKNILAAGQDNIDTESQAPNAASTQNKHAITRGADYYRR